MTKQELEKQFTLRVMPKIRQIEESQGRHRQDANWPLRRDHWDAFMVKMRDNESITQHQFEKWERPPDMKRSLLLMEKNGELK